MYYVMRMQTCKGTPIYAASETITLNEYTKTCDAYSFSMIIFELMTLKKRFHAYCSCKSEEILIKEKDPKSLMMFLILSKI